MYEEETGGAKAALSITIQKTPTSYYSKQVYCLVQRDQVEFEKALDFFHFTLAAHRCGRYRQIA
jgi:hypothetical protein